MVAVAEVLIEAESSQERRYRRTIEQIMRRNGVFEAATAQQMLDMLAEVRSGLVAQIAGIPSTDVSFQAAHMRALLAAVDAASTEINTRMGSHMASTVDTAWNAGTQDTNTLVYLGGGNPSLLPIHISTDALAISQTAAADMVRYVSGDFRARARSAITLGVLGQRPAFQIMQDVAELLRTQPTRQDPRLGTTAYQAERIVRTETNAVYSLASHLRQNQAVDIAMPQALKTWITAHDIRVRPSHVLAGQRYGRGGDPGPVPFPTAYMVGGEAMQHPHDPKASAKERINCRCISILINPAWEADEAAT